MTRIKDHNFFVIEGWMITRLGLTGNELLTYAIIYGFSQTGNQRFTGSRQYIADFIGVASKRTVDNILQTLQQKDLLEKRETIQRGVKFCEYTAKTPWGNICTPGAEFAPPVQNLHHPRCNNCTTPGAEFAPPPVQNLHPIININKDMNKDRENTRADAHVCAREENPETPASPLTTGFPLPKSIADVQMVATARGILMTDEELQDFFDWHTARGWRDAQGFQFHDWRFLLRGWVAHRKKTQTNNGDNNGDNRTIRRNGGQIGQNFSGSDYGEADDYAPLPGL